MKFGREVFDGKESVTAYRPANKKLDSPPTIELSQCVFKGSLKFRVAEMIKDFDELMLPKVRGMIAEIRETFRDPEYRDELLRPLPFIIRDQTGRIGYDLARNIAEPYFDLQVRGISPGLVRSPWQNADLLRIHGIPSKVMKLLDKEVKKETNILEVCLVIDHNSIVRNERGPLWGGGTELQDCNGVIAAVRCEPAKTKGR
jgi:hypothetical protein